MKRLIKKIKNSIIIWNSEKRRRIKITFENPMCEFCGKAITKKEDIEIHDKPEGIQLSHYWCLDEHEERLLVEDNIDRADYCSGNVNK